jgi:hypothetical protein
VNLQNRNARTDEVVDATETPMLMGCPKGKHSRMSSALDTAGIENETEPEMVATSKMLSETYRLRREGNLPERRLLKCKRYL